jgi:phosphoglycolate phosphatase
MRYDLVIFDFDGTLADSFPFFIESFNGLADTHGFERIDRSEVPALRHLSPRQLMQRVGLPAWKLPLVAKSFIARMRAQADQIALFNGVDTALHQLARAGLRIAIVSSNSQDNIGRVLGPELSSLVGLYACGSSIFGKAAHLRRVLKRSGLHPCQAIYIGDAVSDLEAARKVGIAFGAVSWGYGAIESLRQHGPQHVFDEVQALGQLASP